MNKTKYLKNQENASCCNIHISTDSLNLYGNPSLDVLKKILPKELKSYISNDLRKELNYYIIRPRRVESTDHWEYSLPGLVNSELIDYYSYETKERFTSTIKNNGVAFQNPLVIAFKVFDEETLRDCLMFIPTIIHTLKNEHDYKQYISRLKQWVKGGQHPTVLQPFFIKRILDQRSYIFTELINVTTLKDWIEARSTSYQRGSLGEFSQTVLKIIFQIATGMNHLHQHEIVHGDLRPENIYVYQDNQIKIAGLFQFSSRKFYVQYPRTIFLGGSPEYWSPEQGALFKRLKADGSEQPNFIFAVDSLPNLTSKIDVYSFGLVFWELLEGKKEWLTGDEFTPNLSEEEISSPLRVGLRAELQNLALKCLDYNPERRPRFQDIIVELGDISQRHHADEPFLYELLNSKVSITDELNNQAVAYLSHNDHGLAIKLWKEALSKDKNHLLSIYNLGMLRVLKNISDDLDLLRILHSCKADPMRNYLLNLVYIKSGKFATLRNEMMLNPHLILEDPMRRKLEQISHMTSELSEKIDEDFGFILIPRVRIDTLALEGNFLCYIGVQDGHFLCIARLEGPHQKEIIYKELGDDPASQLEAASHLIISPDRRFIAFSLSNTAIIYIRDPNSFLDYLPFRKIKKPSELITALSFNSSSNQILIGSDNSTVTIFGIEDEEKVPILYKFHKAPVIMIRPTDRSNYNLSVSNDCTISIWSLEESINLLIYKSTSGVPKELAVNLSLGMLIYSTIQDHALIVLNLNTQQIAVRLQGHKGICTGIRIAANKRLVLSSSMDGTVRLWNIRTGNCLCSIGIFSPIMRADFIQSGERILFIDKDFKLRARNIFVDGALNGSQFERFARPNEILTNFNWQKIREHNYKKALTYLSVVDKKELNWNDPLEVSQLLKAAEHIKASVDISVTDEIKNILLELNNFMSEQSELRRVTRFIEDFIVPGPYLERAFIASSCISRDRRLFAYADSDGVVLIYDLINKSFIKKLAALATATSLLSFSEDCKYLLQVIRDDPVVRVWDILKGCVLFELTAHKGNITAAAFSPRYKYLITGGSDSQMIIFQTLTKEVTKDRCIIKSRHTITSITVTNDEKTAITASTDHVLRVWNVGLKTRIKLLNGHADVIVQVHIDEESKCIISGSLDGTIRLWSLDLFSCNRIIQLPHPYLKGFDTIESSKMILLSFENSIVCIMDLESEEVKWTLKLDEEIVSAYWLEYPSKIIIHTMLYVKIYAVFWEYFVR